MRKGITAYSGSVPGAPGNYNWPVTFDLTEGYVGISQRVGGHVDRVLLSPEQVRKLLSFIGKSK